ncbi:MAG: RtcB family protein, partial [Candidatus Micrarchaeia archaeon]
MSGEVDIKKVSDYVWMIDRKEDMNVPAVIYASEHMLGTMKKDRTIEQLINVSTLPGIVRAAYLMPDGHEGYGFPIGGVAAFREDDGIVSPGGVGYDINCILPGTRILSSFGFFRPIEAYSEYFSEVVQSGGTVLLSGSRELMVGLKTGRATFFMHKEFEGQVYNIETLSGTVGVTPDHPIITPTGNKLPTDLTEGDLVLTYPFEGVEYEQFCENEEEIAIYARLIGYLTGDGSLTCSKRKMRTIFFGKKEYLAKIRDDIAKLGYHSHLVERTRAHSINGRRFTTTNAELHVYSQQFARKLAELGAPVGNKITVPFRVPAFVRNSPLWIKRLYLAALFSAELFTHTTSSKTGIYMPVLSMDKLIRLESNAREFLLDLSELLKEFDINIAKIVRVKRIGNNVRLRLEISGDDENLLKLYSRIGYEYNTERMVAGLAAILYIRMKARYRTKREEIRARVCELKAKGFRLNELRDRFVSKWANAMFIERVYYGNNSARAPLSIPSFDEFLAMQAEAYQTFGALVDEIIGIKKANYIGKVYDFNVESYHRFVA